VFPTTGGDEIILTTAQGQAIRFSEDDVRPTGLLPGMRASSWRAQATGYTGVYRPTEPVYLVNHR
jgi:DNA gyrase/topoisomerase IV subunit A